LCSAYPGAVVEDYAGGAAAGAAADDDEYADMEDFEEDNLVEPDEVRPNQRSDQSRR
jgi:hypothetical protein